MKQITVIAFFGAVTILTVVSAEQGNCGCAAQPTVIQLSCGGGGRRDNHRTPVGPPAPPPTAENYHETENYHDLMDMCRFDELGYPISNPPGGFPEGFRIITDEDGYPQIMGGPGLPQVPDSWDGREETLGFEMPKPGTPMYNMLMCSPMAVPVITV